METLPSGTVTFFFSDIEGSTKLWEAYPQAMKTALERHDALVRQAIVSNRGQIIKTTGDGFHAAFDTAADAACAALDTQRALGNEPWMEIHPEAIRARIGLHTGDAGARSGDYYGTAVNRAARLMAVGHGGQVLLSVTTADLLRDQLPDGITLVDLGEHRLRDLVRPERIFQLSHPSLSKDFPPLASLDAFPNNLPVQLTSYIGRVHEMAEVEQLFTSARLMTLIGPGGIGKTRLALHVAADLLAASDGKPPEFPNGVWLIELAPLTDPSQVVGEIASTFELHETRGSPSLLEIITNFLRAKQLLLMFDNCEHIVEECARLADHLLRACPGLKMIASSREALGISGEVVYRVPSLSLPDPNYFVPDELLRNEAVQLFIERAKAAQPRFVLTEQNAPAVARICRRLDGIPLALELAAARVPFFTPEQIAARLDDRFRLLTGGSRTALPRQQTLRALIDWSYDLLSPLEQTLFKRLSVFTGGWSIEAAEQVCADDVEVGPSASDPEPLRWDEVFDLLSHLVNKSLVIVNEQEGEARYSFLETIRQYAQEQFHAYDKGAGAGEILRVRDRHLSFFLNLGQGSIVQFIQQGTSWLNKMDAEYENIQSAFEWALAYHPEDALNIIGDLFLYFNIRTDLHESQRAVREALARVEALPPAEGEAEKRRIALRAKGYLALSQFHLTSGETIAARPILEKVIELSRAIQNNEVLTWGLGLTSLDALFLNDVEKMHSASQELIELSRGSSHHWGLAVGLGMLSWAEGNLGHDDQREALAKEALSMIGKPEDPMTYNALLMLGLEARVRGDLITARIYLERCLPYARQVRSRSYEAMIRSELAHIERQSGNYQEAKQAYRMTMIMWNDLGHRAAIAHQLECFAFIAQVEGQLTRAVKLLGAADTLRETSSPMTVYEQNEYQPVMERLRQDLKEGEFQEAWSLGRLLSMEEAIAAALEPDQQSDQEEEK